MLDEIEKILNFQDETKIKCLHNELKIVKEILSCGPIPSMEIMKKTGRSISAHNEDIKRLVDIGVLEIEASEYDKRVRLYGISKDIKNLIDKIG